MLFVHVKYIGLAKSTVR